MNCATHNDIAAVAFCRTCGKPLCGNCTRDVRGVVYCEPCLAARLEGAAPPAAFVPPQAVNSPVGAPVAPVRPSGSGPNPALAGILGAIPFGVGAVYNGQYAKGLAHLFIFVMLIYGANYAGRWDFVFGIGIAFFVIYQIIDAVRTAKALQIGQPAPDPLGLTQTFSMGEKFDSGKVPVGAVVLIGLGVLFLLHTMGVMEFGLGRFWPLLIVVFGGWLFFRNYERSRQICTCGRCSTRWLMGPAMVLTTGVLLLLQTLDIRNAGIDHTWPAWILVVGIVKLLQSSASSAGHIGPLPPAPHAGGPPPPSSTPNPGPTSSSGEVHHV